MKKLLVLTLALMMVLSLTACGGNSGGGSTTTPPANNSTPPASQGNNDIATGGEFYDITDDQIYAYDETLSQVQGEARTTMLVVIPAEIKKAIGTVGAGLCTIQPNQVDGSGYLFSVMLYVSDSADYKTLTDYYKSLGGTIKDEADIQLKIDYSWGKISDCLYQESSGSTDDTISVTFEID